MNYYLISLAMADILIILLGKYQNTQLLVLTRLGCNVLVSLRQNRLVYRHEFDTDNDTGQA